MSRKSLLCAVGIFWLLVGGTIAALAFMVSHEPGFYQRAAIAEGPQRKQLSHEFREELNNLVNGIFNYKNWGARFTEPQINSYLQEDFLRPSAVERMFFPDGIREPRVAIDADRLRLAFRYGSNRWNAIVSLELRIWLAAREPNTVAIEVERMSLGSLPLSMQSILERFSDAARRQGDFELTWYRANGRPVALLRFGPSHGEPSVQLMQVKMHPGAISIHGADRSKPQAAVEPQGAPVASVAGRS